MPYRTQSPDTNERMERLQFELLRRHGPGKRLAAARALSRAQVRRAWSGLKRAHPALSERELQVLAVRLWYGEELGARLETALKKRELQAKSAGRHHGA